MERVWNGLGWKGGGGGWVFCVFERKEDEQGFLDVVRHDKHRFEVWETSIVVVVLGHTSGQQVAKFLSRNFRHAVTQDVKRVISG
jgi:hypothetical protein